MNPSEKILPFLKQLPLFATLNDDALQTISHDFSLRAYTQGQLIVHQADTSRALYIVQKGKARIFKTSPEGHEMTINILTVGDIFGEFAVFDRQPRSASVEALTRCALLHMNGEQFVWHFRAVPELAFQTACLLATKARWTTTYAELMGQYDAAGRLLHLFLLYKEHFGEELEAGKRYTVDLSLNQAGLASLVGVRREWVSRLLKQWHARGLLAYQHGKIIILDLPQVVAERDRHIEANVSLS